MWKQYIKQALYQLKENRLISIVCMVGTAGYLHDNGDRADIADTDKRLRAGS